MSEDDHARPLRLGQAAVPCDPGAPAAARALMSRWLRGLGDAELRDNSRLLVSELVSNSVRHAGRPAGATVLVEAFAIDGHVRIEVSDRGSGAVERREADEDGGFGLQLVESIATRWGVSHARGTLVWFELPAGGHPAPLPPLAED